MPACFQVCLKPARATVFPESRAFQSQVVRPSQPLGLLFWSSLQVRSTFHASPKCLLCHSWVLGLVKGHLIHHPLLKSGVHTRL